MMEPMPVSHLLRLLAAACLLPALLAACSGVEKPPPLPDGSVAGVPTDQPAEKVVAKAVRRFRKADTGTFTSAIGATRDQGRYHLSEENAFVSRLVTAPEGGQTAFTDTVRTPDGVWMRIRTAKMNPKRACWVRSGDALGSTSQDIPGAYAGAVGAALTAEGTRWNDEEVTGTVNLVQALLAVDPSLADAPELAGIGKARTRATITVEDGRLTGWSATSAELVGALAKAGLKARGNLRSLTQLDGFVVDVQFSRHGRSVDVTRPPEKRVIPAQPKDTLLKRAKVCMRQK